MNEQRLRAQDEDPANRKRRGCFFLFSHRTLRKSVAGTGDAAALTIPNEQRGRFTSPQAGAALGAS
eukprot:3883529-Pyramimonas_sp.AAC.1